MSYGHVVPTPESTSPPQYDWLAMVFLAADNDLFDFGQQLLTEAKLVGSSSRVAVVAECDPTEPLAPTLRGQLFNGRWDAEPIGCTSGDPKAIIDFIAYAKRTCPATNRMLILWDHGNGWQNVHVFESVMQADRLAIQDITTVFTKQPGIDIVCFDACLMAMIEIAYQLRGKVQYIVASENVVPADSGWPYDAILRSLTIRPQVTPEQVVRSIVDGFSGSYNGSDQPITLSALRVDRAEAAVQAIDHLSRHLLAACSNGSREKVLFARRYCQSFGNPDYIDIYSFCEELQLQLPDTEIAASAMRVQHAVQSLVIGATHGSARSISGAHGVSIYFPDRPMSPLYQNLDFAQTGTCMWATFLTMVTPKLEPPRPLELRRRAKKPKKSHAALRPLQSPLHAIQQGDPRDPAEAHGRAGSGRRRHG